MSELKTLKLVKTFGLLLVLMEYCFGYDPATCIQCRDSHMCNPPDCFCCRDSMPMPTHDIPQMVFFTFDDAVNPQVANFYRELFDPKRLNPNGCPISMTLFVSHKNTVYDLVKEFYEKGMEIASHSVTHSHMNTRTFIREARLQKEYISKQAGIPENKITGWRSPFLEPVGDLQPTVLKDLGYEYDATLTITKKDPKDKAITPFTLDFGWPYDCKIKPCPTQSHKGFWEVPVVSMKDYLEKYDCVYVDGCNNPPPTEDLAFQFLWDNFQKYYTTNKAPMGVNMHASWFYYPDRKAAMDRFIKELVKLDDVYIISVKQVIEWLKNPTPLHTIKSFQPWQCTANNLTVPVPQSQFERLTEQNAQVVPQPSAFQPQSTRTGLFMPSIPRTSFPAPTNMWQTPQPRTQEPLLPTVLPPPMPPMVPNLPLINFWWQQPTVVQSIQLQEQQQREEMIRRRRLEEQRRIEAEMRRQAQEQTRLQEQQREELRRQELVRQAQVHRQNELERQRQEQLRLDVIRKQELDQQNQLAREKQNEIERQRLLNVQKQNELEKQKQFEAEKQKEIERQRLLEIQNQELEKHRQLEAEKQKENEKQRLLEIQKQKELEKQQQLAAEKQTEVERRRAIEMQKKEQINQQSSSQKQSLLFDEYTQDSMIEPPAINLPSTRNQPQSDNGKPGTLQVTTKQPKDSHAQQFTQTSSHTTKSQDQILEETFKAYISRKLDEILGFSPTDRTLQLQKLSMTELRALQAELRNRLVIKQLQQNRQGESESGKVESQPVTNEIQPIRIGMFLSEFHSTNSATRTKITRPEDVEQLKSETTEKLLNALSTVKTQALTKTLITQIASTQKPTTPINSTETGEWITPQPPPKSESILTNMPGVPPPAIGLPDTVRPPTISTLASTPTVAPEMQEGNRIPTTDAVTTTFLPPTTSKTPQTTTLLTPTIKLTTLPEPYDKMDIFEELNGVPTSEQRLTIMPETSPTLTDMTTTNPDVSAIKQEAVQDSVGPLTVSGIRTATRKPTSVPSSVRQVNKITTKTEAPLMHPIWNVKIATDKPAPWQKWLTQTPHTEIKDRQQLMSTVAPLPKTITLFNVGEEMKSHILPDQPIQLDSKPAFSKESVQTRLFIPYTEKNIPVQNSGKKAPNNGVDSIAFTKDSNHKILFSAEGINDFNDFENAVSNEVSAKLMNNNVRPALAEKKVTQKAKEPNNMLTGVPETLYPDLSFNLGRFSALRDQTLVRTRFTPTLKRFPSTNAIMLTNEKTTTTPSVQESSTPQEKTIHVTSEPQSMGVSSLTTFTLDTQGNTMRDTYENISSNTLKYSNSDQFIAATADNRVDRLMIPEEGNRLQTGKTVAPSRMSPTWLTSQRSLKPMCDQEVNCFRPNCVCKSFIAPGGLRLEDVPQIVTITIDGSLNFHTYGKTRSLFSKNRTNPNGCTIKGTQFVTDSGSSYRIANALYSDGIEIGLMGFNSRPYTNAESIQQDIEMQKEHFVNDANIPTGGIKGWRSPGFDPVGDEQYRILANQSLYDSSLKASGSANGKPKVWPYTLDFGWNELCEHDSCPTKAHPGVWEVPVIPFTDLMNSSTCEYVDACTNQPETEQDTIDYLMKNFNAYYKTNKAPFSIRLKQMWFHWFYNDNFAGLLKFLDQILSFGDVYITSVSDMLEWMKSPKSLQDLKRSQWGC